MLNQSAPQEPKNVPQNYLAVLQSLELCTMMVILPQDDNDINDLAAFQLLSRAINSLCRRIEFSGPYADLIKTRYGHR